MKKLHIVFLLIIVAGLAYVVTKIDDFPKGMMAYIEPNNEFVKSYNVQIEEIDSQIEWRQHSPEGTMSKVLIPFIKGTDNLIVRSSKIKDDYLNGVKKVSLDRENVPKGYKLPEEASLIAIASDEK